MCPNCHTQRHNRLKSTSLEPRNSLKFIISRLQKCSTRLLMVAVPSIHDQCIPFLRPSCLLIIFCISIVGVIPNLLALEVEDIWDGTTGQSDECKQGACPLVT